MNDGIVDAIIGAIGIAVGSMIAYLAGNTKRKLENTESLVKLTDQVNKLSDDLFSLKRQVDKLEDKMRVMWQYIYALITQIKNEHLTPVKPPAELESDPVLQKLFKKK